MDFAFTSEQDTLIRTLRAFAARELAPRSREWDKRGEFPWDIWRRMGELGLFGFRVPADYGGRGITAFLVDLDSPGVSRGALRDLGSRAVGRAVLGFDHVRVLASHRLGPEGTGFHQVMQGFDYNRLLIALGCLGLAEVSLEE